MTKAEEDFLAAQEILNAVAAQLVKISAELFDKRFAFVVGGLVTHEAGTTQMRYLYNASPAGAERMVDMIKEDLAGKRILHNATFSDIKH